MFGAKGRLMSLAGLAIVTLTVTASDAPRHESVSVVGPTADGRACQFIIRAYNSLNYDVYVDFYDSYVRNHAVVLGLYQVTKLKYRGTRVQNRRIPRGKSMEQRVEASGACSAQRTWRLSYRQGTRFSGVLSRRTKKNDQRTIDLGSASRW